MGSPRLTRILTCSLVAIILTVAANECSSAEQAENEAIGRQLVSKWSQAIEQVGRVSVRYERHDYNRIFETAKFSHGTCAFDGRDRWMIREAPFKKDELRDTGDARLPPQTRTGREYCCEAGYPCHLLVTSTSKKFSGDDRLTEFTEYHESPPSALLPENQVATNFWDRLQHRFQHAIQQMLEPSIGVPLFLPKSQLLDHFEVRAAHEMSIGMRVQMTRKISSEDVVLIDRIDAFFQSGSELPHVIRILSKDRDTRLFFEPVRMEETAEIDEATFELPKGARCTKRTERW